MMENEEGSANKRKESYHRSAHDHDPFTRLVRTDTISSRARKEVQMGKRPGPPTALDLALASTYDHHAVWCAAKGYVVKQERSCVINHSPNYRTSRKDEIHCSTESFKKSGEQYRDNAFHIQLGIPPHHTSNTRNGYGRSADGSFYSN